MPDTLWDFYLFGISSIVHKGAGLLLSHTKSGTSQSWSGGDVHLYITIYTVIMLYKDGNVKYMGVYHPCVYEFI